MIVIPSRLHIKISKDKIQRENIRQKNLEKFEGKGKRKRKVEVHDMMSGRKETSK